MSFSLLEKIASSDVFESSNEKSVMVYLASCVNKKDTDLCYPSLDKIAKYSILSKRTVQNILAKMEEKGFITRSFKPGRQATIYRININNITPIRGKKTVEPVSIANPAIENPTIEPIATDSSSDCHSLWQPLPLSIANGDIAYIEEQGIEQGIEPLPPIIPQTKKPDFGMKVVSEESEATPSLLPVPVTFQTPAPIATRSKVVKSSPKEPRYRDDPEFMQFWEQYPRKRRGDPHAAYKTWQELIIAREAHPEDILRGCVIYAHSREGSGDYAQGCQRWLNDYGWMKNYTTQGDPRAKFNPVQAMLNLQGTGGELEEGVDYIVICGERVLI